MRLRPTAPGRNPRGCDKPARFGRGTGKVQSNAMDRSQTVAIMQVSKDALRLRAEFSILLALTLSFLPPNEAVLPPRPGCMGEQPGRRAEQCRNGTTRHAKHATSHGRRFARIVESGTSNTTCCDGVLPPRHGRRFVRIVESDTSNTTCCDGVLPPRHGRRFVRIVESDASNTTCCDGAGGSLLLPVLRVIDAPGCCNHPRYEKTGQPLTGGVCSVCVGAVFPRPCYRQWLGAC